MVRSEKRNILLVVVISVLAVSVYANECGDHSWEWTNHCYSFHAEKKSRDDASSICRQEGGYLVALNSKEEEDFVTEHLQRNENMFVDHVDFSYIEHEEDAVLESRGRLQREYCEHHYNGTLLQSSLNVLAQNEIPLGSPRRALLSTPAGFSIRSSLIPRAGLGAWSAGLVPRHTVLGEYEGEAVENPRDFTYCWQTESGSRPLYIDGRDEGRSNWLRYVNCARDSREENTDTFNCGGRKFYYTTKDVHPDSELLVWYGASYGKWLGIERNNPGFDFPCGSLNVRMGSIYYVYDKRWVHSDWSNVTYTNWSRDQRTKTRDQSVGLILTHRQTRWHWIPELDYSYYLQEHSPKLPFVCERTKGRSFFLRHQTT